MYVWLEKFGKTFTEGVNELCAVPILVGLLWVVPALHVLVLFDSMILNI